MSFPNIPDIKPEISLDRAQAVDMLLASIALEEKGLANIIYVEGEKLKYILNKLQCQCAGEAEFQCLQEMNREARRTLQTVLKSQMLLQIKLEEVRDLIPPLPRPQPGQHPPSPQPGPCSRSFKIILPTVRSKTMGRKNRTPGHRRVVKVMKRAKPLEIEE